MPSKRRILELLLRDELIAAVERFRLAVLDRRVRSHLLDVLARSRKAALVDILEPFPRDRLKQLCRALGVDDRSRSRADLVARLAGTEEQTSSSIPTEAMLRSPGVAGTQHLLSEVTLRSFKAAFTPRPIPLQPFNVIIGRNGSGKSTLLEALQWIDAAMRRDARGSSDRSHGVRALMNLRSRDAVPSFGITLTWSSDGEGAYPFRYQLQVQEEQGMARITHEELVSFGDSGRAPHRFITTGKRGQRVVHVEQKRASTTSLRMKEPDRLALAWVDDIRAAEPADSPRFVSQFWRRAVFLRLSPNRLKEGSPAVRGSSDPLLDEEGQSLPALLNELSGEQRAALVEAIGEILPGIRDVRVSSAERGREDQVHYSLLEDMRYPGRVARRPFPIPARMLSEGTRRITAILALLVCDPPPTLLCIEEIENGLDPWTVKAILRHLQGAASRGTQVLLTTHSPWVLDDVPMDSILLVRRRGGDTQYEHFASLAEVREFDDSVPSGTRYVHMDQAPE